MTSILQFHVAKNHALYPWKKFLQERYKFVDLYDVDLPCLFFGVYGEESIINNHKGVKVVQFITPYDCTLLKNLIPKENLYIVDDIHFDQTIKKNYKIKDIRFEFKNYSIFKPQILKNKIYCYMRDPIEFKLNFVNQIQNLIPFEIIFGGLQGNAMYYDSIENLKMNYYDHCFLNLNFSGRHGMVTAREFSYMGIKTLTYNCPYDFKFLINLKNLDLREAASIILEESNKIGTIQPSSNPHNVGDEWLTVSFWENLP